MFTVLEVFGNIGGLMGIFVGLGGVLVNVFSGKLFFYEIFSQMYQIEVPGNPRQNTSSNNHQSKEISTNKIFNVDNQYVRA